MSITYKDTDGLWFLLPTICLDFYVDSFVEISIVFLTRQIEIKI